MIQSDQLQRIGNARASRYFLHKPKVKSPTLAHKKESPQWSSDALKLQLDLQRPLLSRTPVSYQRHFVDDYIPNQSSLLPPDLAQELFNEGRMQGQQAAGTYMRRVLEQLLIDLSWASSRLEGNTYSFLATQRLFALGESGKVEDSTDATMLLNHKRAIEFMVDAVPQYGMTSAVISNVHALLMQDLLDSPDALGGIRHKVVHITGTVYLPTQVPTLLEEMFALILEKANPTVSLLLAL